MAKKPHGGATELLLLFLGYWQYRLKKKNNGGEGLKAKSANIRLQWTEPDVPELHEWLSRTSAQTRDKNHLSPVQHDWLSSRGEGGKLGKTQRKTKHAKSPVLSIRLVAKGRLPKIIGVIFFFLIKSNTTKSSSSWYFAVSCGNVCLWNCRGGENNSIKLNLISNPHPPPQKTHNNKKQINPKNGEPSFSTGAESDSTLNVPVCSGMRIRDEIYWWRTMGTVWIEIWASWRS